MNKFTRGLIIGGVVGAALGLTGMKNADWMQKKVLRPGRKAIKRASKVMNEVANII